MLGLNVLIGAGVPPDYAANMIGRELTALTGLDHTKTQAVLLPVIMKMPALVISIPIIIIEIIRHMVSFSVLVISLRYYRSLKVRAV